MELRNQVIFISVLLGIAVFLFMIVFVAILYSNSMKRTRYAKENPKDWLFYKFNDKLYGAFWGRKDEDEVAVKLGIKVENYYKNCELVRTTPNIRNVIVNYIYGIFFLFLFFIFAVMFNPLFAFLGFAAFYMLSIQPTESVRSKAKEMRIQIEEELPQFLDLLSAELDIGFPVDRAIEVLSMKYDCLLSREFLEALNDVKLGGAGGWQRAIERVASKYDVEILSDFVSDITIAFSKGISVAHSVKEKTKMIKQKHMYSIKERAGRTENTILIPIAILQFIPMLVYILIPSISTVVTI